MTTKHPLATGDEVHRPFRWTPADQTAREALNIGATNADDVGCFAWQQDDNTVHFAIAIGTGSSKWVKLSGATPTLAQVLAAGNASGGNAIVMDDGEYVQFGTTQPAQSGDVRLRGGRGINWRDSGNGYDIGIQLDIFDVLRIGASSTGLDFADLRYEADATHSWQLQGAETLKLEIVSTRAVLSANSDNVTGWDIKPSDPTGTSAGKSLRLIAGAGHGTDQNGGDLIARPGLPTDGATPGTARLQTADSTDVVSVAGAFGTATLVLSPTNTVTVAPNGTTFGQIGNNGTGFFSLLADGDNTIGLLLGCLPTLNDAAGKPASLVGGAATTGDNDGGDASILPGAKSGAGADGSAGIQDSTGAWRLQLDASKNFIQNAFASHTFKVSGTTVATLTGSSLTYGALYIELGETTEPGTPTSAYRIWSDSTDGGAFKGKGPSGTIYTIGPADPHCPTCGNDFAHKWTNATTGKELTVCMWCWSEGLPREQCVIHKAA